MIFDINLYNAPGLDGLTARFYQHFQGVMDQHVTKIILLMLNQGYLLKILNRTLICLVLKGQKQNSFVDFKPINLCNVIYKFINKILVIHLEDIISPF